MHRPHGLFAPSLGSPRGDAQLIRELLDDDTLSYLGNKHRDGTCGAKGVRYEDVFAAVRIAEAAFTKGVACGEVTLEARHALSFIDDLLVTDIIPVASRPFARAWLEYV
jgi:hypothetical protein